MNNQNNNASWADSVLAAFVAAFGQAEGARICKVVLPGILGDFRKMLERAFPGVTVQEVYHLEHTKAAVTVRGYRQFVSGGSGAGDRKNAGEELVITDIVVGTHAVTARHRLSKEEAEARKIASAYIRPAGDLPIVKRRGNQYYG